MFSTYKALTHKFPSWIQEDSKSPTRGKWLLLERINCHPRDPYNIQPWVLIDDMTDGKESHTLLVAFHRWINSNHKEDWNAFSKLLSSCSAYAFYVLKKRIQDFFLNKIMSTGTYLAGTYHYYDITPFLTLRDSLTYRKANLSAIVQYKANFYNNIIKHLDSDGLIPKSMIDGNINKSLTYSLLPVPGWHKIEIKTPMNFSPPSYISSGQYLTFNMWIKSLRISTPKLDRHLDNQDVFDMFPINQLSLQLATIHLAYMLYNGYSLNMVRLIRSINQGIIEYCIIKPQSAYSKTSSCPYWTKYGAKGRFVAWCGIDMFISVM